MLAHRGKNWILLQNVCRSLWNAVTTLVNTLRAPNHSSSQPQPQLGGGLDAREEPGFDGVSLAAVYGLACRPLYFAASALTDLVMQCEDHDGQNKVRNELSALIS